MLDAADLLVLVLPGYMTLTVSFSVSRPHFPVPYFPVSAERGCPGGVRAPQHPTWKPGTLQSWGKLRGQGSFWGDRGGPTDGLQNPQFSSPGQAWLPPPSLRHPEPCWVGLGPSTLRNRRHPCPAGAAPTSAGTHSVSKSLPLTSLPKHQPQLPLGEQRARGREGESGGSRQAREGEKCKWFLSSFLLNAETSLDSL